MSSSPFAGNGHQQARFLPRSFGSAASSAVRRSQRCLVSSGGYRCSQSAIHVALVNHSRNRATAAARSRLSIVNGLPKIVLRSTFTESGGIRQPRVRLSWTRSTTIQSTLLRATRRSFKLHFRSWVPELPKLLHVSPHLRNSAALGRVRNSLHSMRHRTSIARRRHA